MRHFFIRWLLKLSIPKKLHIFVALIVIVFFAAFLGLWFVTDIMSSLRSYAGVESLWSKKQNDATFSLYRYAVTRDEQDYETFKNSMEALNGFRQARQELAKPERDLEEARKGFLLAGVNPNDVDEVIGLLVRFRTTSYMEQVIFTWGRSDQLVERLDEISSEMEKIIAAEVLGRGEISSLQILSLEVLDIDEKLEGLSEEFSFALSEASRQIRNIVLFILISSILLLGFIVFFITFYISRQIASVDKAKTEFVSIASHQLRTPITIISWYTEKLLKSFKIFKDGEIEKYLSELYSANRRMSDLVDALLSASRIELGTLAVSTQPTNILAVAKKTISDLNPGIISKKIKFEFIHDEIIPLVSADPKILEIIFNNLISNAVKYTPEEGNVIFSIKKEDDGVLIKVSDTGYGIPEREKNKIFTKLYRSDRVKENGIDGTGLGLYIVKYAVEQSKGEIWFNSKENLGSTFYVKFLFAS